MLKTGVKKALALFCAMAIVLTVTTLTPVLPAVSAATGHTLETGGTLTAENGGDYILSQSGTITDAQILVGNGVVATVTVTGDLVIDDRANGKAPIQITGTGKLTLVVNGKLTVYGGTAGDGADQDDVGSVAGGPAGYAGIAVPTGTSIVIKGSGSLYAYGGDAGDGGANVPTNWNTGGGGGGGAGAGIGGNGGNGAVGSLRGIPANAYQDAQGIDGDDAEGAGYISIFETVKVFAYGGGGGSAIRKPADIDVYMNDGGGGGGYPAAGIGGGGAGGGSGDHYNGAGGFSGATGEGTGGISGINGEGGKVIKGGGGYFSIGDNNRKVGAIGGGKSGHSAYQAESGSGGTGGAGGVVVRSNTAQLTAVNGSYVTTSAGLWGKTPTPIYAQDGYNLVTARDGGATTQEAVRSAGYQNIAVTAYGQGIGAGAGFIERENGTYQEINEIILTNGGTATLENGKEYIINQIGTVTNAQIAVNNNVSAKVTVTGGLTIDDRNYGKSPINITGNGNLDLVVDDTLTLYGGSAGNGEAVTGDNTATKGGAGGAAAIFVPTGASVSITGKGQLFAYGGDAGNGGGPATITSERGGAGGGGAGAGIGGNGGAGAAGNSASTSINGFDGGAATAGGSVSIYENVIVNAYGGGGGSGGGFAATSPGGGGGYPAAGIGGGGAGGGSGDHAAGGGGFSGGNGQTSSATGTANGYGGSGSSWAGGGGYFGVGLDGAGQGANSGGSIGGGGGKSPTYSTVSGNGGIGGAGGTLKRSTGATINAYNGSSITTSKGQWGKTPTQIYAQDGYDLSKARANGATTPTAVRDSANKNYAASAFGQGVGSGAGYTENSNGDYGQQYVPNQVAKPTVTAGKSELTIGWTKPGDNGYVIQGYKVYLNDALSADVTDAMSVKIGGLSSTTEYRVQVAAYNSIGEGAKSDIVTATPWVVPMAPRNAQVTSYTNTTAVLKWDEPADLGGDTSEFTTYQVDALGGEAVVDQKARTATISKLTPGTKYEFTVTATTRAGKGAPAKAAAITTWNVPSAPVISSLEPTNESGKLTLSWTTPGANGTPITGYRIYVGTTNTPYKTVGLVNTTVLEGLTDGLTYNVWVQAVNKAGNGALSAVKTAVPRRAPGVPLNVVPSNVGKGAINLTWDEPDAGGDPIQHYFITYKNETTQVVTDGGRIDAVSGQTKYSKQFTGLDNGTNYIFTVTATNGAGTSLGGTGQMTTWDVPGLPRMVTVDPIPNEAGSIGVKWEAPLKDGNSEILRYYVRAYRKGASAPEETVVVDAKNSSTPTSTQIDNLSAGEEYTITVMAENVVGKGKETYPVSTVPMSVPRAPDYVNATVLSDTQIDLEWAEAYGNGSNVTSYVVEVVQGKNGGEVITFQDGDSLSRKAKVTGLKPYTQYTFKVYAVNSEGDGEPTVSSVVRTKDVPGAPSGVSATPTNKTGEVKLTWSAPEKTGGTDITTYYVFVVQDGERFQKAELNVDEMHEMSTIITGLTDGVSYQFVVAAKNGIGVSPDSTTTEFSSTSPRRPADAPNDLAVRILSGTEAAVSWRFDGSDGGSPIGSYVVEINGAGGENAAVGEVDVENKTVRVTGLTKGESYSFDVKAITAAGDGNTATSNVLRMWADPSAPTNVKATPTNLTGEIKVTWEEPLSNGDTDAEDPVEENHTAISGYYVYYIEKGQTGTPVKSEKLVIDEEAAVHNTYLISGLDDHKDYSITVSAENGAGEGVMSDTIESSPRRIPEAPTIGTVLTGNRKATITTITPNADNGGDPVVAYNIYAQKADENDQPAEVEAVLKATVEAQDGVAVNNVTVPDLLNGQNYIITVKAVNGASNGGGLTSNVEKVRVGMPLAPTNFKVELGKNLSAKVSYDPAEDNGTPIDYYNVYINDSNVPAMQFDGLEDIIYGQENGDTLTVWVSAVSAVGESPLTGPEAVTVGAPTTPQITSLVLSSDRVDIAWDASQSNGNKMMGYRVYLDGVLIQPTYDAETLQATILRADYDLKSGQAYTLQVSAENRAGESPKSAPMEFTFGVPQAPIVKNIDFGPGVLTVSFDPPADDGGSPITKYSVYVNGVCELPEVSKDAGTAEIRELANGSVYNVQVSAWNENGEGARSEGMKEAPATTASEPRNLETTVKSDTMIDLSWKQPSYDGGGDIMDYLITVYDKDNQQITPEENGVKVTHTSTSTNATITGLAKGETYSFSVQAITRAGNGAEAKTDKVTTFREPDAPTVKSLVSGNTNSSSLPVTVTWDVPEFDGGTPIIGYDIYSGAVKKNTTPVTGSSYTIQNMVRGRSYTITVVAVNSVGQSAASAKKSIRVGIPAAPVITGVEVGASAFTLKWNVVEGVTQGYRIYEDGNPEPLMSITNPNTTTCMIDDLAPGQSYRIYMTAYNDLGDGTPTDVIEVVIGTPWSPTLTTAEPGYEEITVKWTKPEVDNGFVVEGYNIYLNGEMKAEIKDPDAVEAKVQTLTGGRIYEVKVSAFNQYGEGQFSQSISATPWSKPARPEITDVVPGDGNFRISFTKPAGNGLEVAGYHVYVDGQEAEAQGMAVSFSGQTATVTNVRNGEPAHKVYVSAFTVTPSRGTLESETPDELEQTSVITGIPAAPAITGVIPGNGQVTINFTKPVTVGTAIIDYTVTYSDGIGTEEKPTLTVKDTTAVIEGLQNGKEYTITVQARNSVGLSPMSDAVKVTPGAPMAPILLFATGGDQLADLSWTTPNSNGADISMYRIYVDGDFVKEATDTKATLTGLVNGTKYLVQVTAKNKNGESMKSNTLTVTPGTVPGGVQNVQVKATSATSVEIRWEAPADTGGLPVAEYIVEGTGEIAYEGTTATITGLTEGASYRYTIKAVNAVGAGEAVVTPEVKTFTKPGTPSWDSISSANKTITAEWFEPADNGGTPVLGYNVYVNGVKDNAELITKTNDNTNPETGAISYMVDDPALELGTKYRITIEAVNAVGPGPLSDGLNIAVNGAMEVTVPGKPTNLEVAPGNGELTVKWKAPTYDGNSPITGYYIYVDEEQKVYVSGAETLTQKVTGLVNGTPYKIYVKAVNEKGNSVPSSAVIATPIFIDKPSEPRNLKYKNNSTMNIMTVTWERPLQDGSDSNITYNVYVNGSEVGTGLETTEFSMEVKSGILYNIMVEAQNSGGKTKSGYIYAKNDLNVVSTNIGDPDTNIDANYDGVQDTVDEVKPPQAPSNLQAKRNGSQSITLTWDAPSVTGGAEIESYGVYVNGSVVNVPAADGLTYDVPTEPGKMYTLQVSAFNEAGEGPKSTSLALFVSASTAPSNLTAALKDNYSIDLKWDAPTTGTVERYRVYVNGMEIPNNNITATSYTYVGSVNKEYIFRVSAMVDGEESRQTDYAMVSTMITKPSAPTGLAAEINAENETWIDLSWTAPENSSVNYYKLFVNGMEQEERLTGTKFTYQAEAGEDYIFQIAAVAAWTEDAQEKALYSDKSNAVSASTTAVLPDAPGTPQNLQAIVDETASDPMKINLTWDAVEGTGIYYEIYVNGLPVEEDHLTTEPAFEFVTVEQEDYIFQVSAFVQSDLGDPSTKVEGLKSAPAAASTKPVIVKPDAPTGLTATPSEDMKTIHLAWIAPANDGVERYVLYLDAEERDDVIWGDATSYDFPVVTDKKEYAFQIAAVNAAGSSKSEIVTATLIPEEEIILPEPAGPPTITGSVSNGINSVKITWTEPVVNAEDITGYIVYRTLQTDDGEGGVTEQVVSSELLGADARSYIFTPIYSADGVTPVTVVAVKDTAVNNQPVRVTGEASNTWNISLNLNIDETGGLDTPSQNIDGDGNGQVDVIGKVVKLTGTINAGGPDVAPQIIVKNNYNKEVGEVTIEGNTFEVKLTVNSASGASIDPTPMGLLRAASDLDLRAVEETYTLTVIKDKCTSCIIEGISIDVTADQVDLGEVVLFGGDANGDGKINVDDLALVKLNYGKSGQELGGDVNGDGKINVDDLALVKLNYSKVTQTTTWGN